MISQLEFGFSLFLFLFWFRQSDQLLTMAVLKTKYDNTWNRKKWCQAKEIKGIGEILESRERWCVDKKPIWRKVRKEHPPIKSSLLLTVRCICHCHPLLTPTTLSRWLAKVSKTQIFGPTMSMTYSPFNIFINLPFSLHCRYVKDEVSAIDSRS